METPYRQVVFSNQDVVTRENLDQIQNNLQWIKTNTPRSLLYLAGGRNKANRGVFICGRVYVGKNKKQARVTSPVKFGKVFDPHCTPNITTGLISENAGVFITINGPKGKLLPDHTGFDLTVEVNNPGDNWKINKGFFVCWQAYGFREDDVNEF